MIAPEIASHAATPATLGSDDGMLEIGDEVVRILTAYGEAQEPRRDSRHLELLGCVLAVAGRGRVVEDRVHPSEAGRPGAQLERVHEALSRLAAPDDLECEHAPETVE